MQPHSRYSTQQITPEDEAAVLEALRSPNLTQGPLVQKFEAELCAYTGAEHCVVVSNGTVALELAYRAAGIKSVITSPLTFMATANAALVAGASVGFVDVEQSTGNARLHPGSYNPGPTRAAYVPVHFAGRAAEIPDTREMGDLYVIEDAAHALGAQDFDGCSRVGSCAHSLCTITSFHPVKPITTGEGGAILTNNAVFAMGLRKLRDHGRVNGLMEVLGTNARLTELQAALGISQLRRCDEMRARRDELASLYCALMHEYDERFEVMCYPGSHADRSWHLYPIRIKNGRRDEVKAKLNAQGIGAQVHYSPIVPLHPYYRNRFGYKPGMFPNAEAWAAEELSLPLHAGMSESDVETVVTALREALA